MLKKLRRFILSTWVGGLYIELLLWLDKRKFDKNLRYKPPSHKITISASKVLYDNALSQIKDKINKAITSKTATEYDSYLRKIDMVSLARKEEKEHIEAEDALKKAWVYKDKDIKSLSDMGKMVEKRISDYTELQKHKLKRDLLRQIRKARLENDEPLASKLEAELESLNGRR